MLGSGDLSPLVPVVRSFRTSLSPRTDSVFGFRSPDFKAGSRRTDLSLPDELLLMVMRLLTSSCDLLSVGASCRRLRTVVLEDSLWRSVVERTFGQQRQTTPVKPVALTWRAYWLLYAAPAGVLATLHQNPVFCLGSSDDDAFVSLQGWLFMYYARSEQLRKIRSSRGGADWKIVKRRTVPDTRDYVSDLESHNGCLWLSCRGSGWLTVRQLDADLNELLCFRYHGADVVPFLEGFLFVSYYTPDVTRYQTKITFRLTYDDPDRIQHVRFRGYFRFRPVVAGDRYALIFAEDAKRRTSDIGTTLVLNPGLEPVVRIFDRDGDRISKCDGVSGIIANGQSRRIATLHSLQCGFLLTVHLCHAGAGPGAAGVTEMAFCSLAPGDSRVVHIHFTGNYAWCAAPEGGVLYVVVWSVRFIKMFAFNVHAEELWSRQVHHLPRDVRIQGVVPIPLPGGRLLLRLDGAGMAILIGRTGAVGSLFDLP